jgi:hypothetical protein
MLRRLARAAACALLLPAAAAAQDVQRPIEEDAADLAYGFCPLYLAGRFSLTGPELEARGFGKAIQKQPHPRVGEMELVSANRADGELAFGGAVGKACTVVVAGAKREAALARLRDSMAFMGLDFAATPNVGPELAAMSVETFKAPVDGQILYVQLVRTGAPVPVVAAQLFVMDR